jgi:hypothetical protein
MDRVGHRVPFVVPDWMKPLLQHINNRGDHTVEDLINMDYLVLAQDQATELRAAMVRAQVTLLWELHDAGLLVES